jgi:hypothetical protein
LSRDRRPIASILLGGQPATDDGMTVEAIVQAAIGAYLAEPAKPASTPSGL